MLLLSFVIVFFYSLQRSRCECLLPRGGVTFIKDVAFTFHLADAFAVMVAFLKECALWHLPEVTTSLSEATRLKVEGSGAGPVGQCDFSI